MDSTISKTELRYILERVAYQLEVINIDLAHTLVNRLGMDDDDIRESFLSRDKLTSESETVKEFPVFWQHSMLLAYLLTIADEAYKTPTLDN